MKNTEARTMTRGRLRLMALLLVGSWFAIEAPAQEAVDPLLPPNARSLLKGKTPAVLGDRRPPVLNGRDPALATLTGDPETAARLIAELRDRGPLDEDRLEAMRRERIERMQRPFGRAAVAADASPDRVEGRERTIATPRSRSERESDEEQGWIFLAAGGVLAAFMLWLLRR